MKESTRKQIAAAIAISKEGNFDSAEKATAYADKHGKSVAQGLAEYFATGRVA